MEIPQENPWKIAENRTVKCGSSPPEQRRKFSVLQIRSARGLKNRYFVAFRIEAELKCRTSMVPNLSSVRLTSFLTPAKSSASTVSIPRVTFGAELFGSLGELCGVERGYDNAEPFFGEALGSCPADTGSRADAQIMWAHSNVSRKPRYSQSIRT